MKKYARISSTFISQGAFSSLDADNDVNDGLNKKLQEFVKKNKATAYRIINVETVVVPAQKYSTAYNLVCLHLEYEV